MDIIFAIFNGFIVFIYFGILRIGTKRISINTITIEKKAILISLMILIISSFVLVIPEGIHTSFAKGGLTIAFCIILFTIWLGIIKNISDKTYEKSVGLLKKFLLNLV
ncbi:hypothetical protein [Fictibacillus norfolkensis]|uniref:Uncharacterized protein n=1 Tax=Fictibacillus norfolkensis TaxID=2762233 RepID=A0ABR8SMW7_9BACL|nr:hypothetical protein [Fictibacillus norfolkensis]MBD7964848.1 hypothetical protein [Fictibacillus norfolkensis]